MNIVIPPEVGIPAVAIIIVSLVGWLAQWLLKGRPSVAEVWVRLGQVEERLDAAETRERAALDETTQIKNIIRPWFRDLLAWDRAGRPGNIPLPSRENLQKLGVDNAEEERKQQ